MRAVFLDIDNTLLSFDAYVKQTMRTGFAHFGIKSYEPYMYDVFTTENNKLWQGIEQGTLTFDELQKIRWNNVFHALGIDFDGVVFEKYFRQALNESAIPEDGAYDMLRYLHQKYILCAASNGPYAQQVHRLEIGNMRTYFDYLFISEKIGASKPSRAFFDTAFHELNEGRRDRILPDEVMIIGDSVTSDIAGGLSYGMKTCLYGRNRQISAPDGVPVINKLQEIVNYL